MVSLDKNIPKKNVLMKFEEKAEKLGINSIAYVKVPLKVAKEKDLKYDNAIVMTIKMWDEIIKESPSEKAKKMNSRLYEKFKKIAIILSNYLEKNGYKTSLVIPNEDLLNLAVLAQEAGLGYIGKNKLLITPELGPQVKITAILTDIEDFPLSCENKHSWISDYCKECEECVENCKEGSLTINENDLQNAIFDSEKCIASTLACSYCIGKCPFCIEGYSKLKTKQE